LLFCTAIVNIVLLKVFFSMMTKNLLIYIYPKKPLFVVSLLISIFFYSCDHSYFDLFKDEDNINDFNYGPIFAIPAVNSTLTVDHIVGIDDEEGIYVDDENLVCFVYGGNIYTMEASDLYAMEDVSSSNTFKIDFNKINSTSTKYTISFPFEYEGPGIVDEIEFIEAVLDFYIDATEIIEDGWELEVEMTIPNSWDDNGNPFKHRFPVKNNITETESSLAGYTLDFEYDEQKNKNYIDIICAITPTGIGEFDFPYEIVFEQTIKEIDYYFIKGFIEGIDFEYDDSHIGLSIFDDAGLRNLFFKKPYIDVRAVTSFGLPLDVHINRFFFYNDLEGADDYGAEVDVDGEKFHNNNPWRINIPENPGDSTITELLFDRSNTNMDELLGIHPTAVNLQIQGDINPDGYQGKLDNFVMHDSKYDLNVEIHLPLEGSLERYWLRDTLVFLFDQVDEVFDIIEWLELKIRVNNGFPVDLISMKIQFMDINYENVYYEIKNNDIFESAKVDENGIVKKHKLSETVMFFDDETVNSVADAERIVISFKANTETNSSTKTADPFTVKIYDHYTIDLQLGARVKMKYDIEI